MRDNVLDAKTFFLSPGQEVCFNRNGYMNIQSGSAGKWQITAITRGAEGSNTREAKNYAVLTVIK